MINTYKDVDFSTNFFADIPLEELINYTSKSLKNHCNNCGYTVESAEVIYGDFAEDIEVLICCLGNPSYASYTTYLDYANEVFNVVYCTFAAKGEDSKLVHKSKSLLSCVEYIVKAVGSK